MIHLRYTLAPSARQDRALRHFLRVQSEMFQWLRKEYATYPGNPYAKVKTLGKAFTVRKRDVPEWADVYSTLPNALVHSCFYKNKTFDPTSLVYPTPAGWKLGAELHLSKVTPPTISFSAWPHLHSYGPRIHLSDIGTPFTLRLTLTSADEWQADVGAKTGDRIIAVGTWNAPCGHGCDESISVGDLVEKVDIRSTHDSYDIDEPILQWCHLDCVHTGPGGCENVWPACDCLRWNEAEDDDIDGDETEDDDPDYEHA